MTAPATILFDLALRGWFTWKLGVSLLIPVIPVSTTFGLVVALKPGNTTVLARLRAKLPHLHRAPVKICIKSWATPFSSPLQLGTISQRFLCYNSVWVIATGYVPLHQDIIIIRWSYCITPPSQTAGFIYLHLDRLTWSAPGVRLMQASHFALLQCECLAPIWWLKQWLLCHVVWIFHGTIALTWVYTLPSNIIIMRMRSFCE